MLQHRKWLYLPVIVIAICFLLIATSRAYISFFLRPRWDRIERSAKETLPKMEADLLLLNQQPIFKKSNRTKNAEAYLSQHVSWDGEGIPVLAVSKRLKETLDSKYPQLKSGNTLEALLADKDFWREFDPNWVEGLLEFDHLDINSSQYILDPLEKLSSQNSLERLSTMVKLPILNFIELRHWIEIYAIKKASAGQAIEGLKLIRHVAQLTQSASWLVAQMTSLALLKQEEFIVTRFKVSDWNLISQERRCAHRRFTWALTAYFNGPPFLTIPSQWENKISPEMGLCAGVVEAAMMSPMIFQRELLTWLPGEPDFSKSTKDLHSKLTTLFNVCHLEAFNEVLNLAPRSSSAKSQLAKIPYVRKAFQLYLLQAAQGDHLKIYTEDRCS